MKPLQRIALTAVLGLSLTGATSSTEARSDNESNSPRIIARRRTTITRARTNERNRSYRERTRERDAYFRNRRVVRNNYFVNRRIVNSNIGPWNTEVVNGRVIFYRYEYERRVNYIRQPYQVNGIVRFRYIRI